MLQMLSDVMSTFSEQSVVAVGMVTVLDCVAHFLSVVLTSSEAEKWGGGICKTAASGFCLGH